MAMALSTRQDTMSLRAALCLLILLFQVFVQANAQWVPSYAPEPSSPIMYYPQGAPGLGLGGPVSGPTAYPQEPSPPPSAYAPEMRPVMSPTMSPTMSPVMSPTMSPVMSPTMSPTMSPEMSPKMSPSMAPGPSMSSGPGPAPATSGVTHNLVPSVGVLLVSIASFLLQ